jgi:FkbM family methyltransferase
LHFVDGWWMPKIMERIGGFYGRSLQLLDHMKRFEGRECVVQAGGHIGCYPKLLAAHFAKVYTFEPDELNFMCLKANCQEPNVIATLGCLGSNNKPLGLRRSLGKNTGKHQVVKGGRIACSRIDDLALDALDLLVIDVEGYEIQVLEGGMVSIERFRPLIVAEENKRLLDYGRQYGDIERKLERLGYRVVDRVGEDIILQCA